MASDLGVRPKMFPGNYKKKTWYGRDQARWDNTTTRTIAIILVISRREGRTHTAAEDVEGGELQCEWDKGLLPEVEGKLVFVALLLQ